MQKLYTLFFILTVSSVFLNATHEPPFKKLRIRENKQELNEHLLAEIMNNDLKNVKELLKKGANVNFFSHEDGGTPLHFAVTMDSLPLVQYLIGYGAYINAQDRDGVTPLSEAIERGYDLLVKYLVEQGADVTIPNKEGVTPLQLSVSWGKVALVSFLLDHGAPVNAIDKSGATALHDALVGENSPEVKEALVKILLRSARINKEDERALVAQVLKKYPLIVAAILGDRSDVQKCMAEEEPIANLNEALVYAAAQANKEVVLYLLGKGADPRVGLSHIKIYLLKESFLNSEELLPYLSVISQLIYRLPLLEQIQCRTSLCREIVKHIDLIPIELAVKIDATAALLSAVVRGIPDFVVDALHAGASPHAVNKEGISVLALATLHPNIQASEKIVAMLLKVEACPTKKLLTNLYSAQDGKQRKTIMKLLLEAIKERDISIPSEVIISCKDFFQLSK
jgi:ankyrin repeat protein